jgi:hypothetical protein
MHSVRYSSIFFVRLLSPYNSPAMKVAYHSCRRCVCVCVCVCVRVCVRIQALDKRVSHSHSLHRHINNQMHSTGLRPFGNHVLHFVTQDTSDKLDRTGRWRKEIQWIATRKCSREIILRFVDSVFQQRKSLVIC